MYNYTRGKDIYRNKEKLGILRGAFVKDRIQRINWAPSETQIHFVSKTTAINNTSMRNVYKTP